MSIKYANVLIQVVTLQPAVIITARGAEKSELLHVRLLFWEHSRFVNSRTHNTSTIRLFRSYPAPHRYIALLWLPGLQVARGQGWVLPEAPCCC